MMNVNPIDFKDARFIFKNQSVDVRFLKIENYLYNVDTITIFSQDDIVENIIGYKTFFITVPDQKFDATIYIDVNDDIGKKEMLTSILTLIQSVYY